MVDYTDPTRVSGVKITATPTYGRSVSGYGGAIPTRYMVRIGTWLRVKAMAYGNSATVYVRHGRADYVLDSATVARLEDLAAWADRVGSEVATEVTP